MDTARNPQAIIMALTTQIAMDKAVTTTTLRLASNHMKVCTVVKEMVRNNLGRHTHTLRALRPCPRQRQVQEITTIRLNHPQLVRVAVGVVMRLAVQDRLTMEVVAIQTQLATTFLGRPLEKAHLERSSSAHMFLLARR